MKYRVAYGYMERDEQEFPSWEAALTFAKSRKESLARIGAAQATVSIYNDSRCDGDSYGLTEEQQAEWEGT